MAPERINPMGDRSYDIRSDVWSLGISMIEIATGAYGGGTTGVWREYNGSTAGVWCKYNGSMAGLWREYNEVATGAYSGNMEGV